MFGGVRRSSSKQCVQGFTKHDYRGLLFEDVSHVKRTALVILVLASIAALAAVLAGRSSPRAAVTPQPGATAIHSVGGGGADLSGAGLSVQENVVGLLSKPTSAIISNAESLSKVRMWATAVLEDPRRARVAGGYASLRMVQVLGTAGDVSLIAELVVALEAAELGDDYMREIYLDAASSAWQSGDNDTAAGHFRRVLDLSGDRPLADMLPNEIVNRLEAMAWLRGDAARRNDPEYEFAMIQALYETTKQTYVRAPTGMTSLHGSAYTFARALAARGEPQRAVEVMDDMMGECPSCGVESGQRLSWIAEKANFFKLTPDEKGFSDVYEEIVAHPDFITSRFASMFANNLAISYRQQGRIDAALLTSRYVESLALDAADSPQVPADRRLEEKERAARAAIDVAEMLWSQGQVGESMREFHRVLAEYPDSEHRANVEARLKVMSR